MSEREPVARYSEASPLPATQQARALFFLLLAFTVFLLPLFYLQRGWPAVIAAYAIPPLLIVALLLANRVAKAGQDELSPGLFVPGLFFIVGGAVFDMIATVVHSPDLSQEQNPIARTLLDNDHSISFVYGYAILCQSLYVTFIATLWSGLLRHRRSLVDSVSGSRTFLESVKAATGGRALTWRQWCFPRRLSELPEAYHVIWMITAIVVAMSAYRWYLGLEWYNVLPGYGFWVGTAAVIVGLAVYFAWIWSRIGSAGREDEVTSACA